ncbi:MAG TPA: murein L,D-transpeptidase catalytic domain family protein [Chitinophagaceae bacterium]|nr:murein L,D-transpeptidase catalytic domain family protein [Chitinophagaceae bacterium]
MKKRFKGFYLLVSSIVIGLLHLPFAFAKSASGAKLFYHPPADSAAKTSNTSASVIPALRSVYDSLHLSLKGLSQQAFDYAKQGLSILIAEGKLLNDSIISIVDFSEPSNKKRLFVIDLKNYKVLFNTLVAHGRNTGREWATSFSNQNESLKSSPGFYVTRETYEGKNGYSLKLDGLEHGINDKAYERGIVIHGAEYVSQDMANTQGWIGRSWGCPAVPAQLNRPIINTIKNGTCLFIYHPSYVDKSPILN